MKKILCLFICIVMVFSLGVSAFASTDSEYETITGEYRYLPALHFFSDTDSTYHFTYSDEYFTHSGYEYNHDLAIMTLDMEQSLGVSAEGDWSVANKNFYGLMDKIGFENLDANYYSTHEPIGDSIGVSMASKNILDHGRGYTLLAVCLRGHGYGNEWASNFTLGYEGDHQGFGEARDLALDYVKEYIAKYDISGPIKIWLTGFSRTSIVANMMGGAIDQGFDFGNGTSFDRNDLYCYTFESPQGTADENCRDAVYYNIHNILNANDLVPMVSFTQWGHSRFGIDYYLPCRQFDGAYYYELKPAANAVVGTMDTMNIDGFPLDFIDEFHYISLDPATAFRKQNVTQVEFFDEAIDALLTCIAPTRTEYVDNVQADMRELSMTLLGSRPSHLSEALVIFGQKFTQLDNIQGLYYAIAFGSKDDYRRAINLVEDILMEAMKEAGCAGYDGQQVRDLVAKLVPQLLNFFKSYPDTVLTLLGNILLILNAHCPEISVAWLAVTPEEFFTAQHPMNFVDVPENTYYYDAVEWACSENITNGVDLFHFAPDLVCTRAQAVTFLYRAAGSPEVKPDSCPFVDVSSDSYYHDAVIWAAENGITLGTDSTHFSPDLKCSRGQIVTFLYRYEGSPKVSASCPFIDVNAGSYYCDAVIWAAAEGVTNGVDATHFAPDLVCTRAQIVTFMYRCMA